MSILSIKIEKTEEWFRHRGGSAIVALSGGVDSAVLLALATRALGPERVLAVTGRSASLAAVEERDAEAIAARLGCRHRFVDTRETDDPAYRANRGDRCFHCRTELFRRLDRIARAEGYATVAYGAIADDLGDDRPGMRAAEEAGAVAPLLAAGWTKQDVRATARTFGLPVHDKPASPCLSSRVPVGLEVTPERLRAIEAAEEGLRALGFRAFRVRHLGDAARVELDGEGLRRVRDADLARRVEEVVRRAGFREATIDPEGYRTGGAGRVGESTAGRLYSIGPARPGGA